MTREQMIDEAVREGFRTGLLVLDLTFDRKFPREVHTLMREIAERRGRAENGVGG